MDLTNWKHFKRYNFDGITCECKWVGFREMMKGNVDFPCTNNIMNELLKTNEKALKRKPSAQFTYKYNVGTLAQH